MHIKKQSGFTLIELMVVMAIIAILATAGLSAYTGYIKKARDTTRIADLGAINTIVLASMASTGLPPVMTQDLVDTIKASNNNQRIIDPLTPPGGFGADTPFACLSGYQCIYYYGTCDGGTGYILASHFESASNSTLYEQNASGPFDSGNIYYDIGSCSDGSPIYNNSDPGIDVMTDYT